MQDTFDDKIIDDIKSLYGYVCTLRSDTDEPGFDNLMQIAAKFIISLSNVYNNVTFNTLNRIDSIYKEINLSSKAFEDKSQFSNIEIVDKVENCHLYDLSKILEDIKSNEPNMSLGPISSYRIDNESVYIVNTILSNNYNIIQEILNTMKDKNSNIEIKDSIIPTIEKAMREAKNAHEYGNDLNALRILKTILIKNIDIISTKVKDMWTWIEVIYSTAKTYHEAEKIYNKACLNRLPI